MTKHPDGGMYGIKLIHPPHLLYREFTEVRDGTDGKFPLMNFNISRESQAANIPIGHQCLVFVTKPPQWGRFIWAVEFIGTLGDGDRALIAWGHPAGKALPGNPPALPAIPPEFSLHRPIRFIARVDPPKNGPRLEEVRARSQFDFVPNAYTHKYLTREDYRRACDAINWTWRAP